MTQKVLTSNQILVHIHHSLEADCNLDKCSEVVSALSEAAAVGQSGSACITSDDFECQARRVRRVHDDDGAQASYANGIP